MAKLAILLALFSLLALRHVTAFRTIVTTTVVDEMNPQDCQEQIRRQEGLRSCQRFLSQQEHQGSYRLMMVVDENEKSQRAQETLSECCRELRNVDEQCRCQAVSHAFKQHLEHGETQGQQESQVRQRAENLPNKCNISPQRCQIQSVWA